MRLSLTWTHCIAIMVIRQTMGNLSSRVRTTLQNSLAPREDMDLRDILVRYRVCDMV